MSIIAGIRPNYRRASALSLEIESARKHLIEIRSNPASTLDQVEDAKAELHHLQHEFFKIGTMSEQST